MQYRMSMRLVLDSDPTVNTVRSYAAGEIIVGEQRIHAPCILSAQSLILDWAAERARTLSIEQLQPILELKPSIVLIGSDEQWFPQAAMRREFAQRGIALESMSLGAACRTYNVLVQEYRPVAAGLFPSAPEEDTG
jgi:uncharacterized protein